MSWWGLVSGLAPTPSQCLWMELWSPGKGGRASWRPEPDALSALHQCQGELRSPCAMILFVSLACFSNAKVAWAPQAAVHLPFRSPRALVCSMEQNTYRPASPAQEV